MTENTVPAGPRWQRWKQLHNEGTTFAQSEDVERAIPLLEAAYRETLVRDVDTEGKARRASTLVNLAAITEPRTAIRLLTEAIELTLKVEKQVGDHFGTIMLRGNAYSSRAQNFVAVGKPRKAFADVARGLVDVRDATSGRELATFLLHNVRTGLLMSTGRLAEAEAAALATIDLAMAVSPELAAHPYANLAAIANAIGDKEHAEMYEQLAQDPPPQRPISARWHRCVELNMKGAELSEAGDYRTAATVLDEAYRETLQHDEIEALVCRAAIAGNRAGLSARLSDFDDALRWSTETIELARIIESQVGNSYGTTTYRVDALGTRAQYLRYKSQFTEALDTLDEAFAALDSVTVNRELLAVTLHAIRAAILAASGRFEEGTAAAEKSLELAYESAPHLVPYAHMTLADIAGSINDRVASAEHFQLARELFVATADVNGEATALLSLARLAHFGSRDDEAEELYAAAEELFVRLGNRVQLSTCLHGRAAVAVSRGEPRDALTLLDRMENTTPIARIATEQVRGSAFENLAEFDNADTCYRAARELTEQVGLWHETLTIDWWWAGALIRRANPLPGNEDLCRRALDLALPAALAAEALRQRFSPGPMRERWISLAAAPATREAFVAIHALGDSALAAAYIDHLTATVSLRSSQLTETLAGNEILSLPLPMREELALAASAQAGPAFPLPAFTLPPRVRADLAVPSPLDPWIDLAEQRYGFPVRSKEVIRAW